MSNTMGMRNAPCSMSSPLSTPGAKHWIRQLTQARDRGASEPSRGEHVETDEVGHDEEMQ